MEYGSEDFTADWLRRDFTPRSTHLSLSSARGLILTTFFLG